MRKDVVVAVSLDATASDLLARIAERETEGNKSQAFRYVVKEAAERRGLLDESHRSAVEQGVHDARH